MATSAWESILVAMLFFANSSFGLLVFLQDKKRSRNRYFLGFSLSLTFVVTAAYISEFFPSTNPELSIFFTRLTLASSLAFVTFLLLFSFTFRASKNPNKISKILYPINGIIFLLTLASSSIARDIELRPDNSFDVLYGNLYYILFLPYLLMLALVTFFNFFLGYKHLDKLKEKEFNIFS